MKKIPLRIRLVIITSIVLAICCLIITISVLNSAIMKLDSIEAGMINLSTDENTEIVMNLGVSDLFPEITEYVANAKADFIKQSIFITIGVIIFGAVVTFFASRLMLKPISELSEAVEETTEHNLVEPLPVPEPNDEVRNLTESFNIMKDRLAKAFSAQKQFSANAAHELKTPLAVMQTGLEVFQKKEDKTAEEYEEVMADTLTQLDRMNHMVETLLTFQSMHTLPMDEDLNIAELVDEIVMDLYNVAKEKNVELEGPAENGPAEANEAAIMSAHVKGNSTMLYRAIYNLTENAIKYNREGGSVNVNVSLEENEIVTSISDTGCGIPKEQWEKIFEAFYRVDKSRSRKTGGTGLGLAMVKEIADVHGGRVWVKKSDENGTVICFSLPVVSK